jgi:hypothetical protein
MAFRNDLSGLRGGPLAEVDRTEFASDAELFREDLLKDGRGVDGVRSFESCLEGDGVLVVSGGFGRFCLVFGAGNGGNDSLGALETGWEEGWGNAEDEAIFVGQGGSGI